MIIDSFQYLPQGVSANECNFNYDPDKEIEDQDKEYISESDRKEEKYAEPDKEFEDGEFILIKHIKEVSSDQKNTENETEIDRIEGSGDYADTEQEDEVNTEETTTIWNPLMISVVVVGGSFLVGALSYGAYQLRKIRLGVEAGLNRDIENM